MLNFTHSGTTTQPFFADREVLLTWFLRLPVPGLWLDILQKIKALGYNCVSFYVNWGLLEAKPGEFRAEGIFAFEPLFEAAERAGLYLFAVSYPLQPGKHEIAVDD